MNDDFDDGYKKSAKNDLTPLNIKKKDKNPVAVAVKDSDAENLLPTITAAGRGKIAEQILQIAFESNIKVRQDAALANMLTSIELDSPIPSEAFMAVAEILSYVYRANGQENPYDAVLNPLKGSEEEQQGFTTTNIDDEHRNNTTTQQDKQSATTETQIPLIDEIQKETLKSDSASLKRLQKPDDSTSETRD